MKLSNRSAWPTQPSPWAQRVQQALAHGRCLDLTSSNPTTVGLHHDDAIYRLLGDPAAAWYQPCALGLLSAREAVCHYYARRGRSVQPDRVWLCSSTSDAYTRLLTLLADPTDVVLVPQPGYPLLDIFGDLTDVRLVPYPLHYDGGWAIDFGGLDDALKRSPQARAVVVIAPGNPTGAMLDGDQWAALQARARDHDLALIVDEVFADYPHAGPSHRLRFVGDHRHPCFVLSGLSKVAALPQFKLSWIVMHGPEESIAPLRARAELADDAYLNVATPVQLALPQLLIAADSIQVRIQERLRINLGHLRMQLGGYPLEQLCTDGGWVALIRLPQLGELDDLGWAQLLLQGGVVVQPGFLFDLPDPPRIVVSLLTPPGVFVEGIARLLQVVDATLRSE